MNFLPWQEGEFLKNPQLAETLTYLSEDPINRFYHGKPANDIASAIQADGGVIDATDMAEYSISEIKPVHGIYRGYDIYSVPPPSSGGVCIIELLNILESYDLKSMGHNSIRYIHTLSESHEMGFCGQGKNIWVILNLLMYPLMYSHQNRMRPK